MPDVEKYAAAAAVNRLSNFFSASTPHKDGGGKMEDFELASHPHHSPPHRPAPAHHKILTDPDDSVDAYELQHPSSSSRKLHTRPSRMSIASSFTDVHAPSMASSHTLHNNEFYGSAENGGGRWWLKPTLAVCGASLALFCTFGQMNSFGTYHSWYSRHQLEHLSPSKISWIGSLQLWVFFFSGGFIGRVFDSYGPRYLMLLGSVLYAASVIATSVSTQYYEFMLSQGLLFGLAVGLLFYPSLASVSTHFLKYRATALGIAAAGSSFGGVLYPIVLQHSFQSVGYGWGVRVCGLISALGCVASAFMVTTKYPPQGKSIPFFDLKSILDLKFALLVIGCCFVALGLFAPFFFIVEYARHLSIPNTTAFYVLAVMNAGGVFGRIAPAYLSDRVGRFNLLFPSALFSGLSCLVGWFWTKDLVGVMVFAAVYGFWSGSFISLITPCVAQISNLGEIGTRIGMLYTIISVPSLIGGPTAGAILGLQHGSYVGMILYSGCTVVLGSGFILATRLVIERRWGVKV
ncbi:monocarboxylate permease [Coprinopsis cinerea AmutBmut pab1-1]|nr:monocarboxylate permease [Coprinopsis cinerea AmutBmut pab1-1]